jgi:hypothetical protein
MSDVEILGRPLYRPVKNRLQEEQNPLVQPKFKESTKTLSNADIVYERDEGDWWWCEDA